MNTEKRMKRNIWLIGTLALFTALALSACFSSDGLGGDGPVFTTTDSASFHIIFNTPPYTAVDSIDVKKIRDDLGKDSKIQDSSIKITGLSVAISLDSASKAFLFANAGVRFVFKVYYEGNLALATDTASLLQFDSNFVNYELNKNIYGVQAGYHGLTHAIQDTTIKQAHITATVELKDALKKTGYINANCVLKVSAAGLLE